MSDSHQELLERIGRVERACRRWKWLALGLALFLSVSLLGGAAQVYHHFRQAQAERDRAEAARFEALQQRQLAEQSLEQARQAVDEVLAREAEGQIKKAKP